MSQDTYRIIFFRDSRYGNFERYVIVKGDYISALREVKRLESLDFTTYVSRYYPIDSQYISQFRTQEPRLKPMYKDMGSEKFFNKNL